jgi:hypothetical protein
VPKRMPVMEMTRSSRFGLMKVVVDMDFPTPGGLPSQSLSESSPDCGTPEAGKLTPRTMVPPSEREPPVSWTMAAKMELPCGAGAMLS